jgi:hypothetical protein
MYANSKIKFKNKVKRKQTKQNNNNKKNPKVSELGVVTHTCSPSDLGG